MPKDIFVHFTSLFLVVVETVHLYSSRFIMCLLVTLFSKRAMNDNVKQTVSAFYA